MYNTIIHPLRKALCLSLSEYAVLDSIYQLSNNVKYAGWCVISKQKLAKALDLSERTVQRHITTLLEKEYIMKQEPQGWLKTKDIYNDAISNRDGYIYGLETDELKIISASKTLRQMSDEGDILSKRGGDILSDTNNIYIYNNNKYSSDEAFDLFYKLYPRKVSKANAKKAFRKIKGSEFQLVMDGLNAQLSSLLASEPQYRPHPASWLNARRWEDEVSAPAEKTDEQYVAEYNKIGGSRFKTLYGRELHERIWILTMKS